MAKGPRLLSGMAEVSFKRTPEGWLFQSPSILGPFRISGSHYLLSDGQKDLVAEKLRHTWLWSFVALFVGCLVLPPLSAAIDPRLDPTMKGAFYGTGILALTTVLILWQRRAIRPLLAGAKATGEGISIRDRMNTQAATHSIWVLLVLALGMVVLSLTAASQLFSASGLAFAGHLLCTIILGALAVYGVMLVVLKMRTADGAYQ